MKIAVLIPTRNNRPELLKNCLRMIATQTVQPDHIEIVNDEPLSDVCDITYRYRIGYDRLRNKGFDVIFLMEDDDFYSPDYIEKMLDAWFNYSMPDIFGTEYTIYYHIGLFAWFEFQHFNRSSAMSTIIKPDLDFAWCPDWEPYTDMHLWRVLKGLTFKPSKHICLGIKHGTTMSGGHSHITRLHRYRNIDVNKELLRSTMDPESFNFYTDFLYNKIKNEVKSVMF